MGIIINKSGIISASGSGASIGENMALSNPSFHSSTSYNPYQINLNKNMVLGRRYTIQLWNVDISHSGKSPDQLNVSVFWNGGMNLQIIFFGLNSGHAEYLVGTFTAINTAASSETNSNIWIWNSTPYVNGNMYMNIERWKLEEGEIATPFSYSPADPLYIGTDGFIEDKVASNTKFIKDTIYTNNIIEY